MRLLCFIALLQGLAFAQDERFFRKIFTDELREKKSRETFKIEVSTPAYMVDLNRDGVEEQIIAEKRDGLDFIQIKDHLGNTKFESSLATKGGESSLYKIWLVSLSANTDALVLHFDEGNTGNVVFQSTARLYLVTIENRDLDKIYFKKGPTFYYEKEILDHLYVRRYYNVSAVDYNKDGVKEVSVSYNKIQRIYFYLGKGRWRPL